jgi:peroxiredoxin
LLRLAAQLEEATDNSVAFFISDAAGWRFVPSGPTWPFHAQRGAPMIQIGDRIPATTLMEYMEVEGNGCSIGPNPVDTVKASAGKTIAVFALPGAFTPTCSAKHVPGYVAQFDALKAAGVDEIWCLSVNDAFVMGAWARDQKTGDKVRMLADGSADFEKATGLTLDLTERGMGLRSNRYSMLLKDGVVKALNIEGPGKFEVSDADTLLAQVKAGV